MNIFDVIQYIECDSFSQKACENAAKSLGLQLGGDGDQFAGDHPVKGCHAYESGHRAGLAFYGTGGTELEMKQETPFPNQYRPKTKDCPTKGTLAKMIDVII